MADILDECGKDLAQLGYKVDEFQFYTRAYMNVDSDEKAQSLGFRQGEYYIFNAENVERAQKAVTHALDSLVKNSGAKKDDKILLVGLGNPLIEADSLGTLVSQKVIDGGDGFYKFCPNIHAVTGINTFDFVRMVANGIGAKLILVVDSLASNSLTRLAHSIQLTSAGLAAGSGVGEKSDRICKENLGIPTIAIGVPLIFSHKNHLLTPKDISFSADTLSSVLAEAINSLLL